ncbi:MAG: T9SS type A sorting domain-containing protein, partial [Chitinophagaceae bacterium]|nr:T9SS type A sorting domain-containing protein [Chitinophagaceae bacterium]
ATDTFYAANTAGTYTLQVYLGSCSDTSNEASLKVNPLPASDFTRTGATGAICQGSSLELTALAIPPGWQYQWLFNGAEIPGADKRKYFANTGGYYSVRIRDANNCRKVSDEQLIINTPMGIPDLSPKDVVFCEGTTIKLYANAGPYAVAFTWAKDGLGLPDIGASILAAATGAYEVTATDIYGCKATSKKVSITAEPLPLKPVITQTGSILSVSGIYAAYQWYRNGKMISGATKSTLTLAFDGNYHVVVSGSSGCDNTSDTIVLKNLAVEEIRPAMSIKLYPNPAQSMVFIEAPIPVTLLLRDQQGRRVAEISRAQQVDMSGYADGLYLFTFYDEQGQVLGTQNIIKRTE